jgi:hypothetical protein
MAKALASASIDAYGFLLYYYKTELHKVLQINDHSKSLQKQAKEK